MGKLLKSQHFCIRDVLSLLEQEQFQNQSLLDSRELVKLMVQKNHWTLSYLFCLWMVESKMIIE